MTTVGNQITRTADEAGTKPRWLDFIDSTTLQGDAELPSGVKRLVTLTNAGIVRTDELITVDPISLPADTVSPWRCAIYAPDGSYIVMNGLNGYPTVGTPAVRLSDNAPSRAIIRLPLMRGADNTRLPTFAKWTGGYIGMIKRGMELSVEYRDTDTGNLVMVFRGRIFQIASGEAIEITAYDRLMDLAQYSDQYQPALSNAVSDEKDARTEISGSNYIYNTSTPAGTLINCRSYNLLSIDSLSSQGAWCRGNIPRADQAAIVHNTPAYSGTSTEAGGRITQLSVKVGWSPADDGNYTILHVRFYQFVKEGGGLRYITETATSPQTVTGNDDTVLTFTASVDWQTYGADDCIGAIVEWERNMPAPYQVRAYWMGVGSRIATSDYWTYSGGTATAISNSQNLPEIAAQFTHAGNLINTGQITVSGTQLSIPESSVPAGPTDGPLSTIDKGIGISVSYYPQGAVPVRDVVIKLLEAAGLEADVPADADLGSLSYYTTSTYDYMTCVHELIRAYNMGLKDTVGTAGRVQVRPRHTISEAPIRTITTDPEGLGERIIVAHDLTAHWMAEKATVAYITEDATSSGLALALETDDRLMAESLAEDLDTPLRQVIADNTMGTHQMMASAAGGKIVQLHTNVFEGTVSLAGYRTTLWDLAGSGEGGMPLAIDVPEYDAQGVAVPTEMEIRDGVTILNLNNIRNADRSEVAQSMGLTADAISNSATQLPDMVYIFAVGRGAPSGSLTEVGLDGNHARQATQNDPGYLKTAEDNAGYLHYCAMFPPDPGSTYSSVPIEAVEIVVGGQSYFAVMDNPKTLLQSQGVHIDIRFPK